MKAREVMIAAADDKLADPHTPPNADTVVDAILAALAAAGFKVVGREPTEAMVEIGSDAVYEVVDGYDFSVNKMAGAEVWRAMFDAAEPQEKT